MSVVADTFNRNNQSGWGTASDGQHTWLHTLGTATLSILSNAGHITGNTSLNKMTLGPKYTDMDVVVRLKVSDFNNHGIVLRSTASNTHYAVSLLNAQTARISKYIGGVFTQLHTFSVDAMVNTYYMMRACIQGDTISAKFWLYGSAEPGAWDDTITDTSITAAGNGGLIVVLPTSTDTADFDSFTLDIFANTVDVGARARIALQHARDIRSRARLQDTTAVTGVASDDFTRANQTGWGTATSGDVWSKLTGAGVDTILTNRGKFTSSTGGAALMTLGVRKKQDVDVTIRVSVNNAADLFGVAMRVLDGTTYYAAYWNGSDSLEIKRVLMGAEEILATYTYSVSANTYYWIRGCVATLPDGTAQLSAKIWEDGGSEPADWLVTYTDTAAFSGQGLHGVYFNIPYVSHIVFVNSYTAITPTLQQDILVRANIAGAAWGDILALALIGGNTATLDLATRAGIGGFVISDVTARACFAEAYTPMSLFTPATIDIQIGALTLPAVADFTNPYILLDSLRIAESLDGRCTCDFTIVDPTGEIHLEYHQRVVVNNSIRGIVFEGYVNTPDEENLYPNDANMIAVTCIDEHMIPDKRVYEGKEFEEEYAGNIAAFMAAELADDGVTAGYAIRRDTTQVDFSEGLLSNVASVNTLDEGDLELAPAGDTVSIVEDSYAQFANGTLVNVQANSPSASAADTLSLKSCPMFRYQATATMQGVDDMYTYSTFWSGSGSTIASGDVLVYGMWVSSACPQQKAGIDMIFTDGTRISTFNAPQNVKDQSGIFADPRTDLGDYAKDTWYMRTIDLTICAGKVVSQVQCVFEGDEVGEYTAYFRGVQLKNSSGVVRQTYFWDTLSQGVSQRQRMGYIDASAVVFWGYEKTGYRISPEYFLAGAGIAKSSIISWDVQAVDEKLDLKIYASLDSGNTYQLCTSGQPVPGLMPGLGLANATLMLKQVFTNTSTSPDWAGCLAKLVVTVAPSYHGTKADVRKTWTTVQDWNSGTLVGLVSTGNSLSFGGQSRDWDDGVYSNQTLYGGAAPSIRIDQGQCHLISNSGADIKSRLDFAGQWQNFVAEVDIKLSESEAENIGIVYRTTGWNNTNNTYAYSVFVTQTGVTFAKGSNGGAGSYTLITSAAMDLSSGAMHRLRVDINGNSHKIYLDGMLAINTTDSSYTGTGYIGLRYYNNTGVTSSGYFDNFGVVPLFLQENDTGYFLSYPVDLSSIGTLWDSYIGWDEQNTVDESSVHIYVSYDGGNQNWPCTNGAPLPELVRGELMSGKNISLYAWLSTGTLTVQPKLNAVTIWAVGQLQSSGYRISPPLSLSPVGRIGSTSVSWQAQVPNEYTRLNVDVSPNGVDWTNVSDTNGGEIPFYVSKQVPAYSNFFATDETDSYASGYIVGGGVGAYASWTIDFVQQTLTAVGGEYALYGYMQQTMGDGEIVFDMLQAERGGCVWHLSADNKNCYELNVQDDTSQRNYSNSMRLMKVVNGVHQQLGDGVLLNFQRGTPTRFVVKQEGTKITVRAAFPYTLPGGEVFGGTMQEIVYYDYSPLPAGYVALRSNGGTNIYSSLRIQSYGDTTEGKSLYTRTRLSTSDPTASPQIESLTVGVYGEDIERGELVPVTTYSTLSGSTNSIAQNLDDLAKQSNYWWLMRNKQLQFKSQQAVPSPIVLTAADMLVGSKIRVVRNNDLYRNEQIIIGGVDIEDRVAKRIADGFRTTFDTTVKIDTLYKVTVGGYPATFGIKNVDVDKDWYYQKGEIGIVQAAGVAVVPSGTQIVIEYAGQIPIISKARNNGQIAMLAAIDETSGIITAVEQAEGLNKAAQEKLCLARLRQYSVLTLNIAFATYRPGLAVGQLVTLYLPKHGIRNMQFLITNVDCVSTEINYGGQQTVIDHFSVQCTSGPIIGTWMQLFS